MIIHCLREVTKKRNQSSRQDRDRSTSEDFDLEKLGRCAKESSQSQLKFFVLDYTVQVRTCFGGMEVR